MNDGRHMALLALELGPVLNPMKRRGASWQFVEPGGSDASGKPHLGMIIVRKGRAALLFTMTGPDRIEVRADGIGETKGTKGYARDTVTPAFVVRAVSRFLERAATS